MPFPSAVKEDRQDTNYMLGVLAVIICYSVCSIYVNT